METFLAVLLILGLIAASNIVNRFIPFVPIPLIQIGLGVIAALMPTGIHMTFEPELFLYYLLLRCCSMTASGHPAMNFGTLERPFCCWRWALSLSPSLLRDMRSIG